MDSNIFTYGSLMFERVWSQVVSGQYRTKDARLCRFKRRKIRDQTYPAALSGAAGDFIDGKIYLTVSPDDIARLDIFEGDFYEKKEVICRLPDQSTLPAFVYVVREKYINQIEDTEWDPQWFAEIGISIFLAEYEPR